MRYVVEKADVELDPDNLRLGSSTALFRETESAAPQDDVHDLSREIRREVKEVARVECDAEVALNLTPNDPSYNDANLWGVRAGYGVDGPTAWNTSTGGTTTVVAVIDTGVDYSHQDLNANMWTNPNEVIGDGIDNDGNGFVDDRYGADFVNSDSDPMDDHSHGTHVAGTIGAVGNNGIGVVGVNWRARILAAKVLSASGSGYISGIIAAVNYVTDLKRRLNVPVRVMNMSLGGGGYVQSFKDAIDSAGQAGIILAAAAGNSAQNSDISPAYPAAYTSSNIISVAASDVNGNLAYFSNYGVTSVDIAAPGYSILSTLPGNQYGVYSGTSMATPHIAGMATLLLAVNPALTVNELIASIVNTGVRRPNLSGVIASGAIANLPAAIRAAQAVGISASGTITRNGVGVSGVTVAAGSLGSQTTNSSGAFAFSSISAGTAVTFTPSGQCLTFTPASISATLSASRSDLNFAAATTQYPISGRVVDENGTGLSNASVTVQFQGGASTTVISGANGDFSGITGACGSSYTITVLRSAYTFPTASGTLSSAANLTLSAYSSTTYPLSGRVVVPGGAAVSGATIVASSNRGLPQVTAQTVADGTFLFPNMYSPETYSLDVSRAGYNCIGPVSVAMDGAAVNVLLYCTALPTATPTPLPPTPTPRPTATPTPTPTPTRTPTPTPTATPTPTPTATPTPTPLPNPLGLTVRVEGPGGTLAGVRVNAEWTSRYGSVVGRTKFTDANGLVSYDDVPEGAAVHIIGRKSGYDVNPASLIMSNGAVGVLTAAAQRFTVSGQVVDKTGQRGIGGATVSNGAGGSVVTDASGRFDFVMDYGAAYVLDAAMTGTAFDNSPSGVVRGNVERVIIARR